MTTYSGTLSFVLNPLLPANLDSLNTKGGLYLTYDHAKECWKTSHIMPHKKMRSQQQDSIILKLCAESLSFLSPQNRVTLASRVNDFYTDGSIFSTSPDENGQIRFNSKIPKYSFLSNFKRTVLVYRHSMTPFPSVEALFSFVMAEKLGQAGRIDLEATPVKIKKAWGNVRNTWLESHPSQEDDLDDLAIETMQLCTDLKYDQNPVLARLLVETDEVPLFEQSTTSLVFGSDRVVDEDGIPHETGANALGHILEQKRKTLREH